MLLANRYRQSRAIRRQTFTSQRSNTDSDRKKRIGNHTHRNHDVFPLLETCDAQVTAELSERTISQKPNDQVAKFLRKFAQAERLKAG